MLQLVYISSVSHGVDTFALEAILAVSRKNNRRDGITGLLIHDSVRFLQALEGPTVHIEAAYARISGDPRHRAPVIISRREVEAAEFGSWEMAYETINRRVHDSTIVDLVDRLVATIPNPNTRALFAGFARTDRKVA